MALSKPLIINSFDKGSSENANIGFGTMLGIENYSKKGVAQLTKDTVKVSGSVVTDLIVSFTSSTPTTIFAQGDTGKVYISTNSGTTWVDISPPTLGAGGGLSFYQGFVFAWRGSNIDYLSSPYGSGNWTQGWQTGISSTSNGGATPFLFPNDGSLYFGNGDKVGKIGFGTSPTFNPAGTSGVDYFFNGTQLSLPNYYNVNCISFLPSNYLALGLGASGQGGNAQQIADVVLWNPTLSTYETPLRLFSQAGLGAGGVNQIINRNNTLYAVTGGNHAIFATNGTSYNLVDDISLHTTGRLMVSGNTNGIQATAPIFLNQYPNAIAVLGHKLLTGVSNSINSLPSGYGNFPLGVWSEVFSDGSYNGTQASGDANNLQCEFPISTNTICSSTDYNIGALYPLSQGQVLIGWQDNAAFGIDQSSYTNFQADFLTVWLETQMTEVGSPIQPVVIDMIQLNLVRNLIAGQTIIVSYRTAFDQPYRELKTFVASDGDIQFNNSFKISKSPIGGTKYIQFLIQMSTTAPNQAWTPELRTIIVT